MEQLKAVVYCRGNMQNELDLQKEELSLYAQKNGYHIVRTITEFWNFDDMTWRTLRLMARYREYDILLIDTLDVLSTMPENRSSSKGSSGAGYFSPALAKWMLTSECQQVGEKSARKNGRAVRTRVCLA